MRRDLFTKEKDIESRMDRKYLLEQCKDIKKDIENNSGMFFCPSCKIRTNKKTPKTECVLCCCPLQRVGAR